jgi:hypothetical protein
LEGYQPHGKINFGGKGKTIFAELGQGLRVPAV